MNKTSPWLVIALFGAATALGAESATADDMRHFSIAQLRATCAGDTDEARSFCNGFTASAFDALSILGPRIGIKVCPTSSVRADSLTDLVKANLENYPKDKDTQPALAFVMATFMRQFPCTK